MNIDYLVNDILPKRKNEIELGLNLSIRNPIYVVLELQENICSGHSEYSSSTNYKGIDFESGYMDIGIDPEYATFTDTDDGMIDPIEITRFYTDRIVAFFLTSESAHDYLSYQKHNLTNAYVYVFYSGYGNKQMDALFDNKI